MSFGWFLLRHMTAAPPCVLIDHQKLLEAAEALDVRVTIRGHTHRAMAKILANQTIYCGGSSWCVDNVGGCMVHVIDFTIDESFRVPDLHLFGMRMDASLSI
jgi:hypothetical protein